MGVLSKSDTHQQDHVYILGGGCYIPHQQDQIQSAWGCCRTIPALAPHVLKTLVKNDKKFK